MIRATPLNYQKQNHSPKTKRRDVGFSLVELVMVAALLAITTAIAVPQLAGQRRLLRSAAISKEIAAQLRFARQQAMSQRQSFTFQYDNITKQILIIDNNASGSTVLIDGNYPNNIGSAVVVTSELTNGGLSASELNYGIPSGFPTGALGDGVSKTNLTNGKVMVTFQPDGSVIDAAGNPVDLGIFIYNTQAPRATAAAISVLGSGGRIKLWRYDESADSYVE